MIDAFILFVIVAIIVIAANVSRARDRKRAAYIRSRANHPAGKGIYTR